MTAFTTTARSAKRTRQTLLRLSALSLVVMLATAFTAAPAFGAKPVKNPGDSEYATIELAGVTALRGGPPAFSKGSAVAFDTTVVGVKGAEYPRVSVTCMRADGTAAWGSLTHPEEAVVLGAGGSLWSRRSPTPDTTCEARLFAFGGKH